MPRSSPTSRLLFWQIITAVLLTSGYAGYYLCRSNLSVSLPVISDELSARGADPTVVMIELGRIVSLGTLAYAVGKFCGGSLADFFGGRTMFLVGMVGAMVFTVAFAASASLPVFALIWCCNRLVQSIGWPGLVKVSSRWYPSSQYGTVMGTLSLSYLFGDAISRGFMGLLFHAGLGWRAVFMVAALIMLLLLLLNVLFLRESPENRGLMEPEASPLNVFRQAGADPVPSSLGALLIPLLTNSAFWLVCLLSFGLTLLRETFNTWTTTYLVQGVGLDQGTATSTSALFPLFGGLSVIVTGMLSDHLGRYGRGVIIVVGLTLTGPLLAILGFGDFRNFRWSPVVLMAVIGFLLIGPYSYLAGAISLDLGGKRGSATASGIIDGFGYLGGTIAGVGMAQVAATYGWQGVFLVLGAVACLSSAAAGLFLISQVQATAKTVEHSS